MSIVYRSTKGSKLTSAEVDGNFQHLENLVGGEGNSVIEQTGFTLLDQDLTINSGWNWRILGVLYTNTSSVVISIPFANTENHRIDLIVANQSNTFERIAGIESTSNPIAPAIPSNKIAISFITVTDGVVGVPTEPIIGTQFKKKTESLGYGDPSLSGTNAVIQLRPEGNSRYAFSNPGLISIDGFGLSLILGNPNAEAPYDGKDLFIENTGTTQIILLHDGPGTASSKFFFTDEQNLTIPAGGKVWLKYSGTYCEVIFKSWNNETPTFQQVTDQGNVTDNEITAEAFKTPNYGSFGSIVFNNGELQQIGAMFTLADEITPAEYVFPAIGGEMATKEWVDGNEFAFKSELFEYVRKDNFQQYNYAFSETIDSIRLDLPATESYLIISTLIQSINGFNVPFSDLFEGKDYFIYNNSSDEITLKHNADNAAYDFNFKKGVNIKLPRRGLLHLKFIGGKFIDVIQSWIDSNELQPYLDTKQDKAYNVKVTTPSSIVTGTTSEVQLLKIEIPAYSFAAEDVLNIPSLIMSKVGVAASYTLRVKLSSSPTMPTGTGTETIAFMNIGNTNVFTKLSRNFIINGGFVKGYPLSNASSDVANSTTALREQAFDNTITNYLYVSINPSSSADSFQLIGFQINNF